MTNDTTVEPTNPEERKERLEELLRRNGLAVTKGTVMVLKSGGMIVRLPVKSNNR